MQLEHSVMGRTLIFAGGKINYGFVGEYLSKQNFDSVVCADSGLDAAYRLGLNADFLMGDFDSVSQDTLKEFTDKNGAKYVKLPKEKDYTDLHLVLEWVVKHGASEIIILGATGGRLDHFLANVNILMLPLKHNVTAYIVDECNKICLINGNYKIQKDNMWGRYVSVIPLTQKVTGVELRGLKYPLSNAVLEIGGSTTVSNELAEGSDEAVISLQEGILIVIEAKD